MQVVRYKASLPAEDDITSPIRNVWKHNMEAEFKIIREVVLKYRWIAMDTEFPGIVVNPTDKFRCPTEYQYKLMNLNVNMLLLIQLGLTFMDEDGNTPPGITTWQFNFKFDLSADTFSADSIELLKNCGIQFEDHKNHGIAPVDFAELLITSGLVLLDEVSWLSFHSGYDFGYLLRLLTNKELPQNDTGFFAILQIYFPNVYDIKHIMQNCDFLGGGLQELANQLDLKRVGTQHQAGSDSLLTGKAFFTLKERFFKGNLDYACGQLYGLRAPLTADEVKKHSDQL